MQQMVTEDLRAIRQWGSGNNPMAQKFLLSESLHATRGHRQYPNIYVHTHTYVTHVVIRAMRKLYSEGGW